MFELHRVREEEETEPLSSPYSLLMLFFSGTSREPLITDKNPTACFFPLTSLG